MALCTQSAFSRDPPHLGAVAANVVAGHVQVRSAVRDPVGKLLAGARTCVKIQEVRDSRRLEARS